MDKLQTLFHNHTDLDRVVALIYSDVLEFYQRAYKFFRHRAWHLLFTFHWGLFERRFKVILNRISAHCDRLDSEAAAIHFSEMKKFRDESQNEIDAFEHHRQYQMTESVYRWLSAVEHDQEEHLHRMSDSRQPKTCDWVLDDPQVKSWIEDETGELTLWLNGKPGSGKSYLCSLIVENLRTRNETSSLYYFCGTQPSGGDNPATILRTLAIQFLQQNLNMIPVVHQAFLRNMTSCSSVTLRKMLGQILPTAKLTRIIIDGVDEADDTTQRELLKILALIQKETHQTCKVLMSSRDEPQIRQFILPKNQMNLGERTSPSLSLYIRNQVQNVRGYFPNMEPVLLKLIEDRLRSKADGMFLWVRLVIAMLVQQSSEAEVESAIDQLPDGLHEAYGRIVDRIKSLGSASRDRVFRILHWMCTAYRQVKIYEIADGIVLRDGQVELNKKTRSQNLDRDIVEICAPLLEKSSNGVLRLVHFSAKEYFLDNQSGPFVDPAQAHLSLAFACVVNLTASLDLVPGYRGLTEEEIQVRVVGGVYGYGLRSYAHAYWADHTVAYLECIGELNFSENKAFIDALDRLVSVCKHTAKDPDQFSFTLSAGVGALNSLQKLGQYPRLRLLLCSWFTFQKALQATAPELRTLDEQQQWKLQKDETYLSLIDLRLQTITECLLRLEKTKLPSHIEESDYEMFIRSFDFPCRFNACTHSFDSTEIRDDHEASHVPSFPCLQCDFADRGFRSWKDLRNHTQKYHMSPEDFEVPLDLISPSSQSKDNDMDATNRQVLSKSLTCWNPHGRKILQEGFRQVLTRLKAEPRSGQDQVASEESPALTSLGTDTAALDHTTKGNSLPSDLGQMLYKVEAQQYDSLTAFKRDLNALSSKSVVSGVDIGSLCEQEFENSGFPVFTSFEHGKCEINDLSNNEPPAIATDISGQDGSLMAISNGHQDPARVPYWSAPERADFPKALEKYGRNFTAIADLLKTKTADEVEQYFISVLHSGHAYLADLADTVDARLQNRDKKMAELSPNELELSQVRDARDNVSESHLPVETGGPYHPLNANFGPEGFTQFPTNIFGHTPYINVKSDNKPEKATVKKRKPPRRALCPHCSKHPDGLRDDYALERHIKRAHKATRIVWICDDMSIDKNFFAQCEYCKRGKRYSSKTLAGRHLRQQHFSTATSQQTLERWIREIEEPNPKYQSPDKTSIAVSSSSKKRRKPKHTPFNLAPVKIGKSSPQILPSMKDEPENRRAMRKYTPSSSSAQGSSEDEEMITNKPSPGAPLAETSSVNTMLLDSVSFDNMIPGSERAPTLTGDNLRPHRANQTLIKPEQVLRLPHLDDFRKRVCQDQVDALYNRLDHASAEDDRYTADLVKLASLSQTLMSNLRDWMRHSAKAPTLPFSV